MARPPQPGPGFSALDRLAQTRAEITGLIAPELLYADEDVAMDHSSATPPGSGAADAYSGRRRAAQFARVQTEQAARASDAERLRVQREAVADWADDRVQPMRSDPDAVPRGGARAARTSRTAKGRPSTGPAWMPLLRHGASIWWRHHPAHAAFEVADSALSHVAVRKPYLMLGVAAGAGALVMLIRPWRLVSITGLLFAALKMSDLRSAFGSVLRGD